MVVYDASGRAVIAHEEYLEREARKTSDNKKIEYIDQIDVYKQRAQPKSTNDVQIVIEAQYFKTLYCEANTGWGTDFEWMTAFEQAKIQHISKGLCRETLVLCSSTARDHFTYNPSDDKLYLPAVYPRVLRRPPAEAQPETKPKAKSTGKAKKTSGEEEEEEQLEDEPQDQFDEQIAFIRAKEIEEYIVPWLEKVKAYMEVEASKKDSRQSYDDRAKKWHRAKNRYERGRLAEPGGPIAMEVPTSLLDKIHLYNAMLQLGLPKFVQLPLVDALIVQMYKKKLSECHLDTLEITVGRFYSRGLAILDPVINHLVGTYYLRSPEDRNNTEPADRPRRKRQGRKAVIFQDVGSEDVVRADGSLETKHHEEEHTAIDFGKTRRRYLKYVDQVIQRSDSIEDTCILPPELPVLGHCIRHWSGVRRNGSVAAAHTGFPLNVGESKRFVRRDQSVALDVNDCEEEQANRFVGQEYCRHNLPGLGETAAGSGDAE